MPRIQDNTAITVQRTTGYYVIDDQSEIYADPDGHMWFAKDIARELARQLGGTYDRGTRRTIKTVVIGYDEA